MCFCICPPCLARAIEVWKVVNAPGQEHPDVHLSFVTFAAKCMVSLGHEVYNFGPLRKIPIFPVQFTFWLTSLELLVLNVKSLTKVIF